MTSITCSTLKVKGKDINTYATKGIIPKISGYPPSYKKSLTLSPSTEHGEQVMEVMEVVHLIYPQDSTLPLRSRVQGTRLGLSAPSSNNNVKGERQ
jgi:hypothetical protein